VPAVPVSHIEFECSCDPADDPTPLCNFWTDVESCILATLCRPLAFGLNRERAGLGNCCAGCLCYSILGPVLVLLYEFIAALCLDTIFSDFWRYAEYYAFFSQLLLLLLLSAAEGFNRTKLKLVTDGKTPDVDCGSAKANIMAYFGCNVVAMFLLFVCLIPDVTADLLGELDIPRSNRMSAALAISFLFFMLGLWVLAALPAQVYAGLRGTPHFTLLVLLTGGLGCLGWVLSEISHRRVSLGDSGRQIALARQQHDAAERRAANADGPDSARRTGASHGSGGKPDGHGATRTRARGRCRCRGQGLIAVRMLACVKERINVVTAWTPAVAAGARRGRAPPPSRSCRPACPLAAAPHPPRSSAPRTPRPAPESRCSRAAPAGGRRRAGAARAGRSAAPQAP